jgi:FkbM family methyltransferase
LIKNRKIKKVHKYKEFNNSYSLMSDEYSREMFAELLAMQLMGEKRLLLSSFTETFISSYENASNLVLSSSDSLEVFGWALKKVTLENPPISFFTAPEILNLALSNRLYQYSRGAVSIGVERGDTVIDAGIGSGDTAVYLASKAMSSNNAKYFAFDIQEEGILALANQIKLNPNIKNITSVLKALSDKNGEVFISDKSDPGCSVVEGSATHRTVSAITIDSFVKEIHCQKIDFIKMDIEGSEVPALKGAKDSIQRFKPKMAISAYHKWDDLLVIPMLIQSIRPDYKFYLDCTTGFGGEAVLYCQ